MYFLQESKSESEVRASSDLKHAASENKAENVATDVTESAENPVETQQETPAMSPTVDQGIA